MQLEWEGKVGPAAVVSAFGFTGVLISLGVMWGSMQGDVKSAQTLAQEAKLSAITIKEANARRDERIATLSERLTRIETTLGYVAQTLERIETTIKK